MTRQTAKEYIRIRCKDLKEEALIDTFLNVELNLSRRKYQKDMQAHNLKRFKRTAFNSGPIFEVPTDLQEKADSIKLMKASTGARASVTSNFSGSNNDIVFTMREPGTAGNISNLIFIGGNVVTEITIGVGFNSSGVLNEITLDFPNGTTTANQIIAAWNAHPVASLYMYTEAVSGETGAGTITLSSGVVLSTTGGTGTGWVIADETSIDNLPRMETITLLAPVATHPKFKLNGSTDGSPVIQFSPKSITYSLMEYDFWLADLAADTDDLGVYQTGEELVLLDMMAKCFGLLEDQTKVDKAKIEYETEKNKYLKSYQEALGAMVQEKERMQTADKAN